MELQPRVGGRLTLTLHKTVFDPVFAATSFYMPAAWQVDTEATHLVCDIVETLI